MQKEAEGQEIEPTSKPLGKTVGADHELPFQYTAPEPP